MTYNEKNDIITFEKLNLKDNNHLILVQTYNQIIWIKHYFDITEKDLK